MKPGVGGGLNWVVQLITSEGWWMVRALSLAEFQDNKLVQLKAAVKGTLEETDHLNSLKLCGLSHFVPGPGLRYALMDLSWFVLNLCSCFASFVSTAVFCPRESLLFRKNLRLFFFFFNQWTWSIDKWFFVLKEAQTASWWTVSVLDNWMVLISSTLSSKCMFEHIDLISLINLFLRGNTSCDR